MVLRLVPALDLIEAGFAEDLQVARVHVASDIKVGVLSAGRHLLPQALSTLVDSSEHERVLATAPDCETGCRAWLEHAISFPDLVFSTVNQLENQIGDIAVEPLVWEGQCRTTSSAPVDELSELALSSNDGIKVDPLTVARVICL